MNLLLLVELIWMKKILRLKDKMIYCKSCLLPNTKPGVKFTEGICSACINNKIKSKINWSERNKKLRKIIKKIKKENPNSSYDCIVPISSGGKDSWFQAYTMSKIFKCKVLCVNLAAHLPTKEGISNLNAMIKDLNLDVIKLTLKPSVHSELRSECFKKIGEPNWAEHCMVFAGVFNAAKIFNVPLIVWGEDISFEFGGFGTKQTPDASNLLYKNDLLKSKKIEDFINKNVSKDDMYFYKLPSKKEIKQSKIKSVYLGYYLNWDGTNNYKFVKKRGFKSESFIRNGHMLDFDNIDEKLCEVNGWMKYLKFGFGYATDELCYEIYNNRLKREDAIAKLKKLTLNYFPSYLDDFLRFHKISENEFYEIALKFLNKKIFKQKDNWWELKNIS